MNIVGTQSGQKKLGDRRRFRTTIGQIKRLIDRGQSGPDRADRKNQSLVKWWHYTASNWIMSNSCDSISCEAVKNCWKLDVIMLDHFLLAGLWFYTDGSH